MAHLSLGQAALVTQGSFIVFYIMGFAHLFLSIMLSIQQVKIFTFYLLETGMKMYLDFICVVLIFSKITFAISLIHFWFVGSGDAFHVTKTSETTGFNHVL